MVIVESLDWYQGCMHGTALAETPRAGNERWPPRFAASARPPTISISFKINNTPDFTDKIENLQNKILIEE